MRLPSALAVFVACLLLTINAAADFNRGSAAAQSGDYETAFLEFKIAAEQGIASAKGILDVMHVEGNNEQEAGTYILNL